MITENWKICCMNLMLLSLKIVDPSNIVTSLQSQMSPKWTDVKRYRQRFPEYTDSLTVNITNNFSDFLYDLREKAQALIKEQGGDIKSTVTINFEATDGLLRNINSMLCRPRTCT